MNKILIVLLLVGLFFVMAAISNINHIYDIYSQAKFKPVEMKILSVQLQRYTVPIMDSWQKRYKPVAIYQYYVGDKLYQNDSIFIHVHTGTKSWAEHILASYQPGLHISGYIAPDDPARSFLEKSNLSPTSTLALFVLFPGIYYLGKISLFILQRFKKQNAGQPRNGFYRVRANKMFPDIFSRREGICVILLGISYCSSIVWVVRNVPMDLLEFICVILFAALCTILSFGPLFLYYRFLAKRRGLLAPILALNKNQYELGDEVKIQLSHNAAKALTANKIILNVYCLEGKPDDPLDPTDINAHLNCTIYKKMITEYKNVSLSRFQEVVNESKMYLPENGHNSTLQMNVNKLYTGWYLQVEYLIDKSLSHFFRFPIIVSGQVSNQHDNGDRK